VGTDRATAALTARARELWEFLAESGAGFAPAVRVAVSPGSALCPPGWVGIVVLGDAALATYLDPAEFRPQPGDAAITPLDTADPGFRQLVLAADPDEVAESGIEEITTLAFSVREHGQVVAAAGYRDWPRGTAQLSVLTAAAARDRGLARAAASAAVAHAIAEGRLPQWRARPLASRRVARALGFRELGLQVSIRLATSPA